MWSRSGVFRPLLWGTTAACLIAIGAFVVLEHEWRSVPPTAAESMRSLVRADFELVDHTGRAVSDEMWRGRWLLVFFGFTACPDVCPTTLNTVARTLEQLGDDAAKVVPLLITVDPARDTPEVLAEYVALFDARIVGLTGTADQIKQAASAFRVYYGRVALGGSSVDYTVDHSSMLYLIDPTGQFDRHFSHGTDVERISQTIKDRLGRRRS